MQAATPAVQPEAKPGDTSRNRYRQQWKLLPWHVLFIALAITVIFPLIWVLYTSLKTNQEFFLSAWGLPKVLHWDNYARAWTDGMFGQFFINSLLITTASLVLILSFSTMTAYVLARFTFRGSQLIFNLYTAGMMFPIVMAMIPLFMLLKFMGLWGDWKGLLLAYLAFSLPFTVFVLVPFFKTLPRELEEAAIIDGAGHYQVFWKVMLPLARPGLVTAGIFNFLGIWNEYNLALVILGKPKYFTLPLGVARLAVQQDYKSDWTTMFAGLALVMVPTLVVYAIFQRQLAEGITAGAVKG